MNNELIMGGINNISYVAFRKHYLASRPALRELPIALAKAKRYGTFGFIIRNLP